MSIKYLDSAKRQFMMYKQLAEKAMVQISNQDLNWQSNEDSNSIVMIIKHMWGNMLSRWTDFRTTDGEKPWRQRDAEFDNEALGRDAILKNGKKAGNASFAALDSITDDDLEQIIYIRNEGHTILEAINRQMAHYSYHAGQIVYISKLRITGEWHSMSIPRNKSNEYNAGKFAQEKQRRNFTDDFIEKKE